VSWGSLITTPFGTALITSIKYGNGIWIAAGYQGRLARSTNGGISWGSLITVPFGGSQISSLAYGNGIWIAVGYSGIIARSADGGFSWISTGEEFQPLGSAASLDCVEFDDDSRFISVGHITGSGIIIYSDWLEAGAGIIERGYNTNGEYIKFSDGTMMCMGKVAALAISNSAYGVLARTFPSPFVEAPRVFANGDSTIPGVQWVSFHGAENITNTGCNQIFVMLNTCSGTMSNLMYFAIGRWA